MLGPGPGEGKLICFIVSFCCIKIHTWMGVSIIGLAVLIKCISDLKESITPNGAGLQKEEKKISHPTLIQTGSLTF